MKKDKLHTVNKWNRPAFMPKETLFALGGADVSGMSDSDFLRGMNQSYRNSISIPTTNNNYLNETALEGLKKQQAGSNSSSSLKGVGTQAAGAILNTATGDKLLDELDPVYHLAGGRESTVGNGLSDAGKGLFKAGATTGNGWLMLAGAGAKVLGGLTNAGFGTKVDKKRLNSINEGINTYSNYRSNAGYFDDITIPKSTVSNTNVYEGGWWSKGKARRKNQQLQTNFTNAKSWTDRSIDNNVDNIINNQMDNAFANYAAYGGILDMMNNNMGATEYGLMSDYLNLKDKQTQNKGNMIGYLGNTPLTFADGGKIHINPKNKGKLTETAERTGKSFSELAHSKNPLTRKRAQFALNARHFNHKHDDGGYIDRGFFDDDTMFALGGDMQTNGADYSTGLTHVDAGDTHEQNPYDGVQMGIAPDNTPNLVEEGETIFNDYVFSNRIKPTKDVLKRFHMYSKGGKMTYADVSKKLEKEAKERPNDPISQSSLKEMLSQLADAQEQQKAEEESKKAREAFEALSPEEQQEVLRQIAEQQQAAEQQANPQEEQQEVPVDENGNPIEGQDMQNMQDMQNGQPVQAPTMEDTNAIQGVTAANGGELHKFDKGGKKNVGTWKNANENHWGKYTRPGLEAFLSHLEEQLKDIPASDMRRTAIINDAINDFNTLQQSYYTNILNGNNDGRYSDAVLNHQQMFDKLGGNKGFYSTRDDGSITNLISQDINLPNGAKTDDIPNHWADGYNGPRTSIRNFGSTEYGDAAYYKDLADRFAKLGITYSPNDNWKYGKDNSQELYSLSLSDAPTEDKKPLVWDWSKGDWVDKPTTTTVTTPTNANAATDEERKLPYLKDKYRYAGLFSPAVGLGLWAAGVGKPDYSGFDAAMNYANQGSNLADVRYVGDYEKYVPWDIWASRNAADASARATDRAIMNNGTNIGAKNASLIANGYNRSLADAALQRQAMESNDARYDRTVKHNLGVNEFNAQAYNQASATNAEIQNRNRQFQANLMGDYARTKLNADAQWNNALYAGLTELGNAWGDYGRENAEWNKIAALANNGVFGAPASEWGYYSGRKKGLKMSTDTPKYKAAKGGKLKKRGLTF